MCCNNSHNMLKYFFGICLSSMLISLTNVPNALKLPLSYFQPILAASFVTIATVKVELIADFYTLAIVLRN